MNKSIREQRRELSTKPISVVYDIYLLRQNSRGFSFNKQEKIRENTIGSLFWLLGKNVQCMNNGRIIDINPELTFQYFGDDTKPSRGNKINNFSKIIEKLEDTFEDAKINAEVSNINYERAVERGTIKEIPYITWLGNTLKTLKSYYKELQRKDDESVEFEEIELTEEDLELEELKKEYKALGGKLRGKQTLEGLKSKIEALKEEIETNNE